MEKSLVKWAPDLDLETPQGEPVTKPVDYPKFSM